MYLSPLEIMFIGLLYFRFRQQKHFLFGSFIALFYSFNWHEAKSSLELCCWPLRKCTFVLYSVTLSSLLDLNYRKMFGILPSIRFTISTSSSLTVSASRLLLPSWCTLEFWSISATNRWLLWLHPKLWQWQWGWDSFHIVIWCIQNI